jgi:dimethylargininase
MPPNGLPGRPPVAALVRELSPRIVDAELTHLSRDPIDPALAREQHAGYLGLLAGLGLELVHLPPLPEHPDGVFVEDVVVVVDDTAVLARPGVASRRGEVASVRETVERRGLRVVQISSPATLDGGDVLQVGDTVFVGLSQRTNAAAATQLTELLAPLGRTVIPVPVSGVLHLKTGATALPDGTIVAVPGSVPSDAFRGREVIAVQEAAGGDVLLVGEVVVLSAAAPRTAELVAARGFRVEPVDISELEKAEAGVTCLSVLLTPPRG